MKVGISYDNNKTPFAAGKKIIEKAIKNGNIDKPDLVLAFASGQIDGQMFFKGMQSVLPKKTPIIGGAAVGIITNKDLTYEDYPAGVAVIQADNMELRIASADNLDKDERAAGFKLIEKLANKSQDRLLLLFYDSLKVPATETSPPLMNASPPLISGIEQGLKKEVPIIGAGMVGDFALKTSYQFCGDKADKQQVTGAMIGGSLSIYSVIMHGCTPMDGIYHTITKIQGPIIFELDGKPIVDIINEIYGNEDWQTQVPIKRLTIGVNHGEKYKSFKESEYVNRLITAVLPDKKGVVIFEPDLEEGTEVQFMLRDTLKMMESVKNNSLQLIERIKAENKNPYLGLYIDCAGRAAAFSETLKEEADEVVKACNLHNIPLLGFYSGVEVAPLLGKSRGLDWTGVLMFLAGE